MQYVTTRAFPTKTRQYEIGELVDTTLLTTTEWVEGMASGAVIPAKFVDTAAGIAGRNLTPGPGIVVYETDTRILRIGDGTTLAQNLPAVNSLVDPSYLVPTAAKTGPYTAVARDLVLVDTTGGSVTITLPTGASAGALVGIRRTSAGSNTVTVQRGGSDTIAVGTGTATSITLTLQDRTVILQSNGSGSWTPITGYQALSSLDTRYAKYLIPTTTKTGPYTAVARDLVPVDTTSGSVTITLPTSAAAGDMVGVRRISGGTNTATIQRGGSDTIAVGTGTATSITLTLQDRVVVLESDGAGLWVPITGYQSLTSLDSRYQGPYRFYTGLDYRPPATSAATRVLTFGRAEYAPFPVSISFNTDRISLEVTSAGTAGATINLGIYADDGFGRPGARLIDAGAVAGDSTGVKLIAISPSLRIPEGICWLVAMPLGSGTAPTVRGLSGLIIPSPAGAAQTNVPCGWTESSLAALPATATPTNTAALTGVPAVTIRVA